MNKIQKPLILMFTGIGLLMLEQGLQYRLHFDFTSGFMQVLLGTGFVATAFGVILVFMSAFAFGSFEDKQTVKEDKKDKEAKA